MPFSATRDMWLVIKARDEASRALRGFARDIRMVGDSVAAANARAARSAIMAQAAQQRAMRSASEANLMAARSQFQNSLMTQKATGITRERERVLRRQITAIERMIHTNRILNADEQLHASNSIRRLDGIISAHKMARSASEEHRVAVQRLGSSMMGVSSMFSSAGIALSAAGIFGAVGLGMMVRNAMEYERQSALTRTQVDGLRYSLEQIKVTGLDVARSIGVPFEQIQPALFDIFSSMEVGLEDAKKLLEVFSKAAVAGQTSIQAASRATIGIMNAFQMPISEVTHLMDVQFQLVQEGVGTYEEWAKRIGLATPSAVRFGQSIEMLAAALAAATRMGLPAARAQTAVARAMDALSHPKAMQGLKELGIKVTDAKGAFRPMIDIMMEFRGALMKMPKAERISAILDVFKGAGGTIEARRFLQNMLLVPGNLEMFTSIFKEMSQESGSFEKAFTTMSDTAAVKSQLLANQWMALRIGLGEALIPSFMMLVGWLQKGVEWFNNLSEPTKATVARVLLISAGVATFLGILALAVGTLAAFIAALTMAGSALVVTLGVVAGLVLGIGGLGAAIFLAWQKSEMFRSIIGDLSAKLSDFWHNYVVPTGLAVRDSFNKHMKPALQKLGDLIEQKVMPVVRFLANLFTDEFLAAAKEIGNWIKDNLTRAFRFFAQVINNVVVPVVKTLMDFFTRHQGTIKQLVGWVAEAWKWMLKWGVVIGGVLLMAIVAVVGPIVILIAAIAAFIIIVIKVIEWVKMLIKWFSDLPANLARLWASFTSFMSGLWDSVRNFGAKIIDWFQALPGKVGSFLMRLVKFFPEAMNLIAYWVGYGLGRVAKFFGELPGKVLNFLKQVWNFANTWWNRIMSTIANWVITGLANVVRWLRTLPGRANTWFISTRDRVVATVRDMASRVGTRILGAIGEWVAFFRGLPGKAKQALSDFPGQIKDVFLGAAKWLINAGINLIKGLIDGVNQMKNAVVNKLRDIASSAINGFMDAIGAGSPSKEFMKLGRFSMEGYILGLNSFKNKIPNLMQNVSDQFLQPLTGPSSGAGVRSQTITIHTNEINPRRHAEELGFLLQTRP